MPVQSLRLNLAGLPSTSKWMSTADPYPQESNNIPADSGEAPAPYRREGGTVLVAHNVGVVTEEEACELARRELDTEDLVITGASRISKTWVVAYNSRTYVETRDVLDFLTGPGPIFVADSGRVGQAEGSTRRTATSRRLTLAESVAEFEQQKP